MMNLLWKNEQWVIFAVGKSSDGETETFLFLRNPQAFPGQTGYIIPKVISLRLLQECGWKSSKQRLQETAVILSLVSISVHFLLSARFQCFHYSVTFNLLRNVTLSNRLNVTLAWKMEIHRTYNILVTVITLWTDLYNMKILHTVIALTKYWAGITRFQFICPFLVPSCNRSEQKPINVCFCFHTR